MKTETLLNEAMRLAAVRAIAEGVEAETGERFFSSLARNLALTLHVQYAFVSHLSDDGARFKILALWERDHFGPNLELPLTGTPCESVLHGETAHYSDIDMMAHAGSYTHRDGSPYPKAARRGP